MPVYKKPIIILSLILAGILLFSGCGQNKGNPPTVESTQLDKIASSQEAVKAILEKAREWSQDAEIHNLKSYVQSSVINDQWVFSGYDQGKFIIWTARLYSPSKKEARLATWVMGKISLGDPYGKDNPAFSNLESQFPNLNYLSQENSSIEAYQKAKLQGLDDKKHYYTMEIVAQKKNDNTNEKNYIWYIYERDPNDINVRAEGKIIKTYIID